MYRNKRKPYFSRYICAYCKNTATRYICASNHKRKYIICDNKKCEKKTLIKLGYIESPFKTIEAD